MKDKMTFKYHIDGKEVEFAVKQPGSKEIKEGKKVYNTTLNEALNTKPPSPLRLTLNAILESQGLWNNTKQAKYTSLNEELIAGIKKLEKGGKNFKVSDAKTLALRLLKIREEIRDLVAERGQLDDITAEGQADNARFQYLVSACLVYNDTDKPYYKNYEDFLQHAEEPLAYIASQHFMNLQYDFQENDSLPEHKFLKKFGFVDSELRLINKDGHLIDEDGRLIDENGRYVDKDGKFVDKDGDPVDDEGNSVFEFQGFIDDETGEIVGFEKEEVKEEEKTEAVAEVTE